MLSFKPAWISTSWQKAASRRGWGRGLRESEEPKVSERKEQNRNVDRPSLACRDCTGSRSLEKEDRIAQ